MSNDTSLKNELRRIIGEYLDVHRTRSIATLAIKSGVSYTTLRRIWRGEGNPTFDPILKIVDVTLSGSDKSVFISRYFPHFAQPTTLSPDPVINNLETYRYQQDNVCLEQNGDTILYSSIATVNDAGLNHIRKLLTETVTQITSIKGNPMFQGKVTIHVNLHLKTSYSDEDLRRSSEVHLPIDSKFNWPIKMRIVR